MESRTDEERCILLDRLKSLNGNLAQNITFKRAQDFFTHKRGKETQLQSALQKNHL